MKKKNLTFAPTGALSGRCIPLSASGISSEMILSASGLNVKFLWRGKRKMPETFEKMCVGCLNVFISKGSKNCPFCGCNEWIFIDGEGRQRIPIVEAINEKRQREKHERDLQKGEMTSARADHLISMFYPDVVRE
jgi:hypothetical protein